MKSAPKQFFLSPLISAFWMSERPWTSTILLTWCKALNDRRGTQIPQFQFLLSILLYCFRGRGALDWEESDFNTTRQVHNCEHVTATTSFHKCSTTHSAHLMHHMQCLVPPFSSQWLNQSFPCLLFWESSSVGGRLVPLQHLSADISNQELVCLQDVCTLSVVWLAGCWRACTLAHSIDSLALIWQQADRAGRHRVERMPEAPRRC